MGGASPRGVRSRSFDGNDVPSPLAAPVLATNVAAVPIITLAPPPSQPVTVVTGGAPTVIPVSPSYVVVDTPTSVAADIATTTSTVTPTGLVAPIAVISERRGSTAASLEQMRQIVADKLRLAQQLEEEKQRLADAAVAAVVAVEAASTATTTTTTTTSTPVVVPLVVVPPPTNEVAPLASTTTVVAIPSADTYSCWIPNCSRGRAEELLTATHTPGTYLLRAPSSPSPGLFVFSFLHDDGSVRPIQVTTSSPYSPPTYRSNI
jgi:hypothetical protein